MANTDYTYNVTSDTANGQVQSDTLSQEIESSFVINLVKIDITGGSRSAGGVIIGGTMIITMADPVIEGTLDSVVSNHQGIGVTEQEDDFPYDNSNSTLTSTNLPNAIDELDANKSSLQHASAHIKDGYDEIDGDQLDIDFNPSNYTPDTTPAEVTDVNHLSAHLSGIDNALSAFGGSIEVQDDDVQVIAAVSALNFGTRLDVVDDGAGKVTIDIDTTGITPDSTQIIAGAGLIGGGDLSANRTLDVVANADGSIIVNANDIQVGVLASNAQHGDRGGGSLHSEATTSLSGFLSASDKTKLDGVESGAQVNTVDSVFGRTGTVIAQTSDYDANQIDFTANGDIAATDVQTAIVEVRDDTDTKLLGKASTSHASTHIQGGSDEIDGDQLDIDFTPSNYTPSTTPSEVDDLDQLSAHLSGIDNALGSVSGDISVEDDDSLISSGVTILNFGDSLSVTDDGSGKVTIDGENAGRAVFIIWAEENAALGNNSYEWAFGNGDDVPAGSGIPVPIDCVLFAVGLDHNASASATVAVEADGVQIATVSTSSQANIVNTLSTPVNVNQGQVIGFQTLLGPGNSDGNRVIAYFRTAPFGAGDAIDSVFGRTGAVTAQSGDYSANLITVTPAGNITSTDVQTALEELDTAIGSAGGNIEVQDNDVQVVAAATTINFGNNLSVTDDGSGKVTIDTSNLVIDSREIIAGNGLTGGGDLSTDRTLNVAANADGSIIVNANDIQVGVLATDAQHGNRGGGSLHANATTSISGFLSASDKTKLDGIESNAEVNDVNSVFGRTGTVTAQTSDYDANQIDFTANGDISATDVQAAIVEVRDDTDTKLNNKADNSTQVIAGAGLTGGGDISTDRTLNIAANADGSIAVNANDIQVGVLATDAQHGDRGGGSLHAVATTSVAGFLSASDKTKLDGIETGATSDQNAAEVSFTSNGDITATDVQAAIVEVRDDTDTKLAGKADITHATTHIQGGSDEIDGDQLDIDFTPANYTPSTSPGEVTDVDQLSAHLAGIDDALEGSDLPALQLRLNADVAATGGFTDIEWPVIDIENEPGTIERDDTNTERIIFKATGLYCVTYNLNCLLGGSDSLTAKAVLNNTTDVPGSSSFVETGAFTSGNFLVSETFIVDIQSVNDYITIQASEVGTAIIEEISTVVVRRLRGAKGDKGDPGTGTTITVQEEGVNVSTSIDTLNFIGADVTATDAGSGVANITVISSGGADGDSFSAYDSAGTQSSTGTLQINIDTEQFPSSANYSLAADTVTVVAAGRYILSYQCTLVATGGGRSQVRTFLEVNTVELQGSSASLYLRQNDYGATGSASLVVDLPANAQITLNSTVTAGGPTYSPLVNSSHITLVRLT